MTPRGRDDRRLAYGLGLDAETRAAWMLRLKLWRILDRRWKSPKGEIDLVAVRGRTLVFVEVKARASEAAAIESVTPRARGRIAAAADVWVARHPYYADHDRRFDLVAVVPGRWPKQFVDWFRPDDPDLSRRRPN